MNFGQDVERAAHGFDAAAPQVAFEERHQDFVLRQYQLGCLSQLTYLLGSGGEAAVIDPQRDVAHYERDAKELGLTIKWVVLTHTNADFVAGHTELAERLGAKILISAESHSQFPHEPLRDGDTRRLGSVTLEFWATPGHTLDCMTTLVHVPTAPVDPAFILTGDTLFIGGIGRPDLMGGDVTPVKLAEKGYESIQRLKALPEGTKVLPAHGAGSLCGAHLSPETVSTIGDEHRTNPYFKVKSRASFISQMISGLPTAPQYFGYNVALNRAGPPVVTWTDELPPALAPEDVQQRIANGAWVVDLRSAADYGREHLSGSVNIDVRGRLDTWTGIVVPFDADLLLVGNDDEVRETVFRFRRIGLDRIGGYLQGGMAAWQAAGLPVRSSKLLTPEALSEAIDAGTEPFLVDVRSPSEHEELRIGNYANIPVTEASSFEKVLDKSQPVVFVCNSAYRSSMAVGLAERQGFEDVGSLQGGLDAWLNASLPVLGSGNTQELMATASHDSRLPMAMPEAMEPEAVARGLMDQPELYSVIDIRPRWQFDEFHIEGAHNMPPASVMVFIERLDPLLRPIVVDRDGTLAFAVAGAVQQSLGSTHGTIRALVGGTAAYWSRIEIGEGRTPQSRVQTPGGSLPPAATDEKPKSTVKRRSAGC